MIERITLKLDLHNDNIYVRVRNGFLSVFIHFFKQIFRIFPTGGRINLNSKILPVIRGKTTMQCSRRRKKGIEGGNDEYCFCRCVGITVDYNRDEPREIALVKRLHSDFTTDNVDYFLQKQKVRFLT